MCFRWEDFWIPVLNHHSRWGRVRSLLHLPEPFYIQKLWHLLNLRCICKRQPKAATAPTSTVGPSETKRGVPWECPLKKASSKIEVYSVIVSAASHGSLFECHGYQVQFHFCTHFLGEAIKCRFNSVGPRWSQLWTCSLQGKFYHWICHLVSSSPKRFQFKTLWSSMISSNDDNVWQLSKKNGTGRF